eukprot:TRINITY_DN5417_c0_g2_i8.p1 TRINITY_DN5417_c0_g2~~TRINITY_DN5417_c0_g2_i8.p1  ORF type:complete len:135 (+),score=5.60 TRINITY_DN5417_c0_g2_i8:434-838(+)
MRFLRAAFSSSRFVCEFVFFFTYTHFFLNSCAKFPFKERHRKICRVMSAAQRFLECSFARRDRSSAVLSGVLEEKLKTVGIHGQCLTVKAIAVDLGKGLAGQALLNVGLKAGNALGVGGVGWGVHCVDIPCTLR